MKLQFVGCGLQAVGLLIDDFGERLCSLGKLLGRLLRPYFVLQRATYLLEWRNRTGLDVIKLNDVIAEFVSTTGSIHPFSAQTSHLRTA